MKNRLEQKWFNNMIWFQQWLMERDVERDVDRKDNQTGLPCTSVPFNFYFVLGEEKSNRSGISSAYNFRFN